MTKHDLRCPNNVITSFNTSKPGGRMPISCSDYLWRMWWRISVWGPFSDTNFTFCWCRGKLGAKHLSWWQHRNRQQQGSTDYSGVMCCLDCTSSSLNTVRTTNPHTVEIDHYRHMSISLATAASGSTSRQCSRMQWERLLDGMWVDASMCNIQSICPWKNGIRQEWTSSQLLTSGNTGQKTQRRVG
jgi:hypothetical protein